MRYTTDFIIPAGTLSADPYTESVLLAIGKLERVLIRFRSGCHNKVFVTVRDGLQQILPGSPDLNLYGNDVIFDIPMQHYLTSPPYALILSGWSPDCLYDHCVTFWFDVVEGETEARQSTAELLAHLGEIL